MKGRIIGRNGRNIHAFEQAAGVDVIVDDTPEAVTISCFDPVRREVPSCAAKTRHRWANSPSTRRKNPQERTKRSRPDHDRSQ
jgi:hypothetical protein